MTSALITQSNYIPWKGYFDSIARADILVLYDDMQYTRRDWRNRNMIKTPQGTQWLTIPVEVKGKYLQKINETKISDDSWRDKHLKVIHHNYSKARFYDDVYPWIKELYASANSEYLSAVNRHFIEHIMSRLGISTKVVDSRELKLVGDKTERLVDCCHQLGADHYFSGPAAKGYMDETLFDKAGIKLSYADYSNYSEYEQKFPPFEHGVSIFDLLLNEGTDAQNYMKHLS